jgi:hypothetical protein
MFALVARKHQPRSTGDITTMRGNRWAVYFALSVLFLVSHNALAKPAISIERDGDTIRILAKLQVDAHHHIAWQVLTDYNNLARFVPGMQISRIVSRPGEPILLKQIGQSGFLMLTFPVEVVTQITEIQLEAIRFFAVSGNLKSQSGEWRIKQEGDRTLVIYQSSIVPGFWVPPLIGPAIISQDVGGKMIGIAEEMQRRAASEILEKARQVVEQGNDL